MVALASATHQRRALRQSGWLLGAAGVLVLGLGPRLVLATSTPGDRSAAVMGALLALGGWLATLLLHSPRLAFFVATGLIGAFDLASAPPRNEPAFDDRQALYRTDQVLHVAAFSTDALTNPLLVLTVEPRYSGEQPAFSVVADVGGASIPQTCPFVQGVQRLALVLPRVDGATQLDVGLRLAGDPRRDGDYLLVYSSAREPRLPLLTPERLPPGAKLCTR